ncbi:MAG: NADH-quinone oxidoreductase subunit NuoE [Acidobacteriota bacterium]
METIEKGIREVLKNYSSEEGNLIPILQQAQVRFGYLSPAVIEKISEFLKITENQVYGVASFYSQFRFNPRGKHSITVCLGTACHVRGGEILLDSLERDLDIRTGECTPDKKFDLDRVACLGCCALAPVLKVDDDIYGNVSVIKIKEILEKYE